MLTPGDSNPADHPVVLEILADDPLGPPLTTATTMRASQNDGATLPVAPGCDGEGEEMGVEQLRSRSVDVVTDEDVADNLARARDLNGGEDHSTEGPRG